MTKQELLNAFCAAVDGLSTAPEPTSTLNIGAPDFRQP
mgnify:CR=1 FL=1|tara:strand:+ start:1570 stop:1683 length:114 start_codon:yes stop_codon:yes gene_type:complete